MKRLKLFEEFAKYKFTKKSKTYQFDDLHGNDYKVVFTGPYDYIDSDIKSGITYDLDFFTQEQDYKKLTNAGTPFSISNFIFIDILTDFINSNKVDTISIFPSEPEEDVKRFNKKIFSKYNLYLRTLNRGFKLPGWKIITSEKIIDDELEKYIILINEDSEFWKKNIHLLEKIKREE